MYTEIKQNLKAKKLCSLLFKGPVLHINAYYSFFFVFNASKWFYFAFWENLIFYFDLYIVYIAPNETKMHLCDSILVISLKSNWEESKTIKYMTALRFTPKKQKRKQILNLLSKLNAKSTRTTQIIHVAVAVGYIFFVSN